MLGAATTTAGSASSESVLNAITEVARAQTGVNKVVNEVGVGSNWLW
jgi:osmotically-inducible protein OsmY